MSAENAKPNQTGKILTIGIGVLLLGGMTFFAVKYFQEKDKNVETQLVLDDMTTEIEDLELDLDNYRSELEDANMDIEEKERLLAEKEQELIEKQKKIDRLLSENKISKTEAEKFKAKIEQLEYYLEKFQKTIEEQKAEIASLKQDKSQLQSHVDTLKTKVRTVEFEKEKLETKIRAASILVADGFRFYRLKSSGKEVEDTEFRKGRIDVIRVCFKIMENLAAEAEDKEIYVQILDPSKQVIKDNGKQSGFFNHMGQEKSYSLKKTIRYEKSTQQVCVDFTQPDNYNYEKGTHTVVVYAEGFDIGKSTFEVK